MPATPATLERALRAVSLRLLVGRAGPAALRAVAITAFAAAIAAPVLRWLGVSPIWWIIAAPALVGIACIVVAAARTPGRVSAAIAIDRSHRLHDALATALTASNLPRADRSFVELQRDAALAMTSRIDPRRVGPALPGRWPLAACGAALAMLVAAILVPWPAAHVGVDEDPRRAAGIASPNEGSTASHASESAGEVASLADRIEQLVSEGDLEAAERAVEEMERVSRTLSQRGADRRNASIDAASAVQEQRTLIESASRLGEAAASIADANAGERGVEPAPATTPDAPQADSARPDEQAQPEPARPEATQPTAPSSESERREELRRRIEELSRRIGDQAMETRADPARDQREQRETSPSAERVDGSQDETTAPAEAQRQEQGEGDRGEPAPREGAPREGASREGASREGASREGASREGASREGASREGAPREGASREGAAREQMPRGGEVPGASEAPSQRPEAGGEHGAPDRGAPTTGAGSAPSPRGREGDGRNGTGAASPMPSAPRDGRGAGSGTGDDPGSGSERPDRPLTYDIEARPLDPDQPGRVLERERRRDDALPVSRGAGARAPTTGGAAGRGGTISDPSIAPRFRPLLERYFERVRPPIPPPSSAAPGGDPGAP